MNKIQNKTGAKKINNNKKEKQKILFISAEVSPFAKVGGLADVVGTLPKILNKYECETRVIMPFYKKIKIMLANEAVFVRWSMIKLGWRSQYSGLYKYTSEGVTYYFIDNEYFFKEQS